MEEEEEEEEEEDTDSLVIKAIMFDGVSDKVKQGKRVGNRGHVKDFLKLYIGGLLLGTIDT